MPEVKDKSKKDAYEKALSAYSQAMRAFRKGDYAKAKELLNAFHEKFMRERELVDRAQIYLSICENRQKDTIPLKSFEDYYQYAVYKLNQKDYKQALKLLEKARKEDPKQGKVVYLMAVAFCLMEETEKCLKTLKEAVHLDKFFGILAQNETDFEPIKEDKKFKVITKLA